MEHCRNSNKALFGFRVVLRLGLFSCSIKGYCVVCLRLYLIHTKNSSKEGVLEAAECLSARSYWTPLKIKLRLFSLDFTTPWCVTPRMLDEYARYALVVGAI